LHIYVPFHMWMSLLRQTGELPGGIIATGYPAS